MPAIAPTNRKCRRSSITQTTRFEHSLNHEQILRIPQTQMWERKFLSLQSDGHIVSFLLRMAEYCYAVIYLHLKTRC